MCYIEKEVASIHRPYLDYTRDVFTINSCKIDACPIPTYVTISKRTSTDSVVGPTSSIVQIGLSLPLSLSYPS